MGLLSLAIPIAVEALVTTISQSILTQPLILLAVILFGTLTFSATMQVAQTYLIEYMQQRLYVRATSDFAYRLPRMRNDNFDNEYAPESVNRFLEIMTMQKTLGTLSLEALGVIVQAIIGMIVLAFYHPLLLGLDLFLIVGLIFMGCRIGARGGADGLGRVAYEIRHAGLARRGGPQPQVVQVRRVRHLRPGTGRDARPGLSDRPQ
jgi:putative ABC transport system ATP-binding protein